MTKAAVRPADRPVIEDADCDLYRSLVQRFLDNNSQPPNGKIALAHRARHKNAEPEVIEWWVVCLRPEERWKAGSDEQKAWQSERMKWCRENLKFKAHACYSMNPTEEAIAYMFFFCDQTDAALFKLWWLR